MSPDSTREPSVDCQRVGADGLREALSVLLTGRVRAREPAVDQFLNFVRLQNLPLDDLWVARRAGNVIAALLIVPSAGRSAMLFVSPAAGAAATALPRLAAMACGAQNMRRVNLIQCLLDPAQGAEQQLLREAGFDPLATLVYMQRSSDAPIPPPDESLPGIEVTTWSEAVRDRFGAAISASYRDTLDCPGLLGLRSIDDVIDGHRATGMFDPETWFCYWKRDEPVAVMLLSQVANRSAFELVYLGLAPAFRGLGLARRILTSGLGVARRCGADSVLLAVDQENAPAMALYRGLGFSVTGRKAAMIYTGRDA